MTCLIIIARRRQKSFSFSTLLQVPFFYLSSSFCYIFLSWNTAPFWSFQLYASRWQPPSSFETQWDVSPSLPVGPWKWCKAPAKGGLPGSEGGLLSLSYNNTYVLHCQQTSHRDVFLCGLISSCNVTLIIPVKITLLQHGDQQVSDVNALLQLGSKWCSLDWVIALTAMSENPIKRLSRLNRKGECWAGAELSFPGALWALLAYSHQSANLLQLFSKVLP